MNIICFGAIGAVLAIAFIMLIINFDSKWKAILEVLVIAGNGGAIWLL